MGQHPNMSPNPVFQAETPAAVMHPPEEQAAEVAPGAYHPLVGMFDKMGLQNVLSDPETSRQFWQDTSSKDAQRLFVWTNGVYRGVNSQERGISDTSPVIASFDQADFRGLKILYMAPSVERAPKLLEGLWEASKAAPTDARAATLLGVGSTIVHGLPYGNGRMARMAYALRKIGYDGSDEQKKVFTNLLTPGSRGLLDMSPGRADLPAKFADKQTENLLRQHKYEGQPPTRVEVSDTMKTAGTYLMSMHQTPDRLAEPHFGVPLALDLITSMGGSIADYVMANGSLDGDKILSTLVLPYGNAPSLVAKSDALKEQYLRAVIDCLAYGDETVFGSPDEIAARYEFGTPARDTVDALFGILGGFAKYIVPIIKEGA